MKKISILNLLLFFINGVLLIFLCITVILQTRNTSNKIWNKAKDSVFELTIYKDENLYGYATGFAIDNYGHMITNKHVVQVANCKLYVSIAGKSIEAKVEKVSENYDVALLFVDASFDNHLSFADIQISVGEEIYTIGNPNGIGLCIQEGIISAPKKELIIDGKSYLVIQTNLVINEGYSGGPILNKSGKVIGIISFKLRSSDNILMEGMSFGYSSKEILDFLNSDM